VRGVLMDSSAFCAPACSCSICCFACVWIQCVLWADVSPLAGRRILNTLVSPSPTHPQV
jgi:hypothetical protein